MNYPVNASSNFCTPHGNPPMHTKLASVRYSYPEGAPLVLFSNGQDRLICIPTYSRTPGLPARHRILPVLS